MEFGNATDMMTLSEGGWLLPPFCLFQVHLLTAVGQPSAGLLHLGVCVERGVNTLQPEFGVIRGAGGYRQGCLTTGGVKY